MGQIIIILMLAASFLVGLYYLELWFFKWVKTAARTKESRFVIMPKEKRIIQRTKGDTFDTFKYDSTDECFQWQLDPYREYPEERDRWRIVTGKYSIMEEFNWWQKYIYDKTGAWWYQGWYLQYAIPERPIDIGSYIPPIEIGQTGRIEKLKDNMTIYLYRTWEGYGVQISGAEDATGNPVTVFVTLPGRVKNPYIAEIETKNWDTLFASKVRSISIPIIHKCHFYKNVPLNLELLSKLGLAEKDIMTNKDEIVEKLIGAIQEQLQDHEQNGGFEFNTPLIQDIVMEKKEIVNEIANTVVSEEKKKQAINEAEGLAAKRLLPGKADNAVRKERMNDMAQKPEMAKLLVLENALSGTQALSLGSDAAKLLFNFPVDNKKNVTKETEETNEEK